MKASLIRLRSILGSRTARNIYFWVFALAFLLLINQGDEYPAWIYVRAKLATSALLIVMTYFNLLVLIPWSLKRKKNHRYVFSAIGLVLVMSFLYVVVVKALLMYHPKLEPYQISLVTSPVGDDWALMTILGEMVIYAVGLAIWVTIFTMAWYMNEYHNQEKRAVEAAAKQRETELHLLRNQLSPHFLFNTLNNIYGLSLKKSDITPEAILKLSALMRYMLYETNEKTISFEKEHEVMKAYIDMELLRLQDSDNYKFHIETDKNYDIPPLLWLPVLENAFKYATRAISDNQQIDFRFTIQDGMMTIAATNSYKDMAKTEQGGVGLNNLRKRLEMLYSDKHTMTIKRDNGIYSILVTIDMN